MSSEEIAADQYARCVAILESLQTPTDQPLPFTITRKFLYLKKNMGGYVYVDPYQLGTDYAEECIQRNERALNGNI